MHTRRAVKIPRLVGRLVSGPRLVGWIGSEELVSASFHIGPVYFALLGPNFHTFAMTDRNPLVRTSQKL